jgi:hypothetical protein
MAVKKNPIDEAKRYMDNAKQILSKNAGKMGETYSDPKYVKLAGHAAWSGVLVALDGALDVRKSMKGNQRPDIKHYIDAVHRKDKKMSNYFIGTYDSLHKALGYDGNLNYKVVQASLEQGKNMINWAAKYYKT